MGPQMRVREAPAEDVEAIYSLACEFAGTVGDSHFRFEDVRARFREPLTGIADLRINTDRLSCLIASWSPPGKERYNGHSPSI